MNILASETFPHDSGEEGQEDEPRQVEAGMTTPGGDKEVQWEVVTKTAGLATAEIIAQRLRSEDIPARAWQEGAGQAIGLTVGLLGTGYVVVPEAYVDQAKVILATPVDDFGEDDEFAEDDMLDADESPGD